MNRSESPKILIVEDDAEQMALFTSITLEEIEKLLSDENTSEQKRQTLQNINILKVNNVDSLEKAIVKYSGVFLVIMDCNLPDSDNQTAHDQLIKTNHRITGQHKPIDIVVRHLPNTPITMISSFNRFHQLLHRYYKGKHAPGIAFISKRDELKIRKNITYHLMQYLTNTS